MSLDQIVALELEGKSYSLAAVLRSAIMQGTFRAIDDYMDNALIEAYAEEHHITADKEDVQAAVVDWRVEKELYQAADVEKWLAARSLTTADLARNARMKVLKERVKQHITSGKVERYFAENRSQFDAAAVSQIVVTERGLARELAFKAQEGAEFYVLARHYSADEPTRLAGGFIGRVERTQLPRAVAAHMFGAVPGTIAGPLEVAKKYYVVKLEEMYPAELDADIRARIERILFEEWLCLKRKQASSHIPLWEQD
ncbi:peptidylprolyl isomerase [Paenibacillus thalictri]|uniref:peptidylprolyl isomerase n=1 Tax=Paenibacillus thalictri TaxID=2527873 RepID=A0A4Q9DGS6_9BACL|nr:peptidylprolyl isomerase [Paenibacillus thalictri]TBL70449.1 hypothetical protein EYB31_33585 [Paenibacillus thalictri]